MYSEEFKDKVKRATDIVALVSEYTKLTKSGKIFIGYCPNPNHKDKDPSFRVWPETQSWACYGCHSGMKDVDKGNYGSDCIAFVQWIKNISFPEAVKYLANRAEIPLEKDTTSRAYMYNLKSSARFHFALTNKVKSYLYLRGLTDFDMNKWQIGFDGSRITFPLYNAYGDIVGFSRRRFEDKNDVKYKNSSTSEIFNKSRYFYGINIIDKTFKELRIVEGCMDVILATKYGARNVVATLGTALTEEHMSEIKKLDMVPVITYDNDDAGIQAAKKVIDKFYSNKIYGKVLFLDKGDDMADAAIKYKDNLEQYISDNSMPISQYLAQKIVNVYDSKMNELKIQLAPKIHELLDFAPEAEKEVIRNYIDRRLDIKL